MEPKRAVALPPPAQVALVVGLLGLVSGNPPHPADDAVQLRGGCVSGQLEEVLLGRGVGDSGQRSDLRVGELAVAESDVYRRELCKAPRDPDVLAGRSRSDPAAPGNPLRARAAPPCRPAFPPVELRDQL